MVPKKTRAQKKPSPDRMTQTSLEPVCVPDVIGALAAWRRTHTKKQAGTGYSVGRFLRYRCSTLFNYNCNLSLSGTILQRLLPLPDNCGLLPTPKETFNLNLSAFNLRILSFRIPTSIDCTNNWRWKLDTHKGCILYLQMSVDLNGNLWR